MKKRLLNVLLPSVVISTMLCLNVYGDSGSGGFRRPNSGVNTVSIGDIEEYGDEYETKYEEGQYLVGTDIPAGEYIVFANLTDTGYFCVSSDPNENDIIYNNNFDYNSIITVNDGEYLNLTRCFAIPFNDVKELDLSSTGMFKVGTHVQSGEYKLISNENEEGYYCLYSSSRQDDIISNGNFSGNKYVSISDEQYLELVRCKFETTPKIPEDNKNETNSNKESISTIANKSKSEYTNDYTYENLKKYPDYYFGNKIKISGEVVQTGIHILPLTEDSNGIYYARIALDCNYDEIIFVTYSENIIDYELSEGDLIEIYGMVFKLYDYESVSGKNITIPWVDASIIELSN